MRIQANNARKLLLLSGILCACLTFPGCGGGGARTIYNHRLTTIGQELSDLKAAKDRGAISEDEYETQREKILKDKE